MREEALIFGTPAMVGILTEPAPGQRQERLPAILLMNAGGLHRVGPNRLYVSMARDLAQLGFLVLRFDFAGIGDSALRQDSVPFERSSIADIQKAMDYLTQCRGVEEFVVGGVCFGAEIAFHAACADERVVGALLINGRGFDVAAVFISNRHMARYCCRSAVAIPRLWARSIVRKIRKGAADRRYVTQLTWFHLKSLRSLGKVSHTSSPTALDLRNLCARGVEVMLVYSGTDFALDYLKTMLGGNDIVPVEDSCLRFEIVRGADHIFNSVARQNDLLKLVHSWGMGVREKLEYQPACSSCTAGQI
jgi:pimeloyl-ACP methyl ester carboxylesterase